MRCAPPPFSSQSAPRASASSPAGGVVDVFDKAAAAARWGGYDQYYLVLGQAVVLPQQRFYQNKFTTWSGLCWPPQPTSTISATDCQCVWACGLGLTTITIPIILWASYAHRTQTMSLNAQGERPPPPPRTLRMACVAWGRRVIASARDFTRAFAVALAQVQWTGLSCLRFFSQHGRGSTVILNEQPRLAASALMLLPSQCHSSRAPRAAGSR